MEPRKRKSCDYGEIVSPDDGFSDFGRDIRLLRRWRRRSVVSGSVRRSSSERKSSSGEKFFENVKNVDVIPLDNDDDDDGNNDYRKILESRGLKWPSADNDSDVTAVRQVADRLIIDDNAGCVNVEDVDNVVVIGPRVPFRTGDTSLRKKDTENGSDRKSTESGTTAIHKEGTDDGANRKSTEAVSNEDHVEDDYVTYLRDLYPEILGNLKSTANIVDATAVCEGATRNNRTMDTMATDNLDDADLDYKRFLDNVQAEGGSYKAVLPLGNDIFLIMKFEIDDNLDDRCNAERLKTRNSSRVEKVETGRMCPRGRKRKRKGSGAVVPETARKSANNGASIEDPTLKRKKGIAGTTSNLEKKANKGTSTDDLRLVPKFGHEIKEEIEDETHNICLNPLKKDRKHVAFNMPIDLEKQTVKEEEECSSDSEVKLIDKPSFAHDFITSKSCVLDEDGQPLEETGTVNTHSLFRERLLEILKKPYDEEEYEDLIHRVSMRKPIQRERNLRGSTKIYQTRDLGPSNLDQYSDLAVMLREADKPKKLKLLRGFFYWMENVVVEGSFMPWRCVMLGSTTA